MSDDHQLFQETVGTVRKLKNTNRVSTPPPRHPITIHEQQISVDTRTDQHFGAADHTDQCWVLKANGVSQTQMRRLARGDMPVDQELDLHGFTRNEALTMLSSHVQQALSCGQRILCVVHGRGLHSAGGKPVLKHAVYDWLRHGPHAGQVLAVTPAYGSGGGSCLILLRRCKGR